jgi:hypothetical protein
MAPDTARMPQEIWAPSSAGPVAQLVTHSPFPVAQHHFAVGADIHDKADFVAFVGPVGQNGGHGVSTHKPGYDRHEKYGNGRIGGQFQFPGTEQPAV